MYSTFLESRRILIVDDQEDMRALACEMLRDMGAKALFEASDGLSALGLLADQGIDLVLCDWQMPRMSGVELLRSLNDTGQGHVPFLLMTGRGSVKNSILRGGDHRAISYIRKPFSAAELEARLRILLQNSRG